MAIDPAIITAGIQTGGNFAGSIFGPAINRAVYGSAASQINNVTRGNFEANRDFSSGFNWIDAKNWDENYNQGWYDNNYHHNADAGLAAKAARNKANVERSIWAQDQQEYRHQNMWNRIQNRHETAVDLDPTGALQSNARASEAHAINNRGHANMMTAQQTAKGFGQAEITKLKSMFPSLNEWELASISGGVPIGGSQAGGAPAAGGPGAPGPNQTGIESKQTGINPDTIINADTQRNSALASNIKDITIARMNNENQQKLADKQIASNERIKAGELEVSQQQLQINERQSSAQIRSLATNDQLNQYSNLLWVYENAEYGNIPYSFYELVQLSTTTGGRALLNTAAITNKGLDDLGLRDTPENRRRLKLAADEYLVLTEGTGEVPEKPPKKTEEEIKNDRSWLKRVGRGLGGLRDEVFRYDGGNFNGAATEAFVNDYRQALKDQKSLSGKSR